MSKNNNMIKSKCILFKVKQRPVEEAASLNFKLLKIIQFIQNFLQEEKI